MTLYMNTILILILKENYENINTKILNQQNFIRFLLMLLYFLFNLYV